MRLDYPAVESRLTKWGYREYLVQAKEARVSKAAATLYAQAICGPKLKVKFKRIYRSWSWTDRNTIVLSCQDGKTVRLKSVLHECAHQLNDRKGKMAGAPHGEAFCRTYARLLKEAL